MVASGAPKQGITTAGSGLHISQHPQSEAAARTNTT